MFLQFSSTYFALAFPASSFLVRNIVSGLVLALIVDYLAGEGHMEVGPAPSLHKKNIQVCASAKNFSTAERVLQAWALLHL